MNYANEYTLLNFDSIYDRLMFWYLNYKRILGSASTASYTYQYLYKERRVKKYIREQLVLHW